jgi:hypothetical protein
MPDSGDQKISELLRLRDEAIGLCTSASQLADRIVAIIDEQVPEPPGHHLRIVRKADSDA